MASPACRASPPPSHRCRQPCELSPAPLPSNLRNAVTTGTREMGGAPLEPHRRVPHCRRRDGEREAESSRWGKGQVPSCRAKLSPPFLPPSMPPRLRPLSLLRELAGVAGGCHRSIWSCVELRCRGCHGRNSSPLLLEVAAGLPLNRFEDRHCSGSAVPPSIRVVETVAKVAWS
ncbi:uncharacterized protein DS421_16g553890 [Arachis hypogaea]|nr:uncharacterized protein DS421_16g553890 [Arachis hypogaea]